MSIGFHTVLRCFTFGLKQRPKHSMYSGYSLETQSGLMSLLVLKAKYIYTCLEWDLAAVNSCQALAFSPVSNMYSLHIC